MRVSISSEKQLLYSRRQSNIERFQTLNVEKLIILNNNALSPRSVPLLKFHGSLKIPRTSFPTKRYNRGEWGENLFRLNSGEIVYTCRVKFHPFRVRASQLVHFHKCNFLQRQDNTGFLIKLEFFISFRSISSFWRTMIFLFFFFFFQIFNSRFLDLPVHFHFRTKVGSVKVWPIEESNLVGSLRSRATEIEFYAERRY